MSSSKPILSLIVKKDSYSTHSPLDLLLEGTTNEITTMKIAIMTRAKTGTSTPTAIAVTLELSAIGR